jgi:hypothetical protein
MRLVKILIRKGIEIDLVRLTQVDPSFVGLGSRCGLIGRFRQRSFFCFFTRRVLNMICIMQQNARVGNNVERSATCYE